MPKRKARPGGLLPKKPVPVASVDAADAHAAMEAVEPSGHWSWKEYVEGQRVAHLHAKSQGDGTTFHAFEALSQVAAEFIRQVDAGRAAGGAAAITDYAIEAPGITVKVPAWVVISLMHGWMRARALEVLSDGTKKPAYSVVEAFHLGSAARSRSVIERHRARSRDVQLALMVAVLFARAKAAGAAMSDHDAFSTVAAEGGVSRSTVRLAWLKHREKAVDVVSRSEQAFSDPTRPLKRT